MKEIQLTQGKVVFVDDEDYERLNRFKWYAMECKKKWYAIRQNSRINGKQTHILMHREIMNATKGSSVDHRNGNGLYNCKGNLRLATKQENGFNRKHPNQNNKLKVKGVVWHKQHRKFQATIKVNGKAMYLGLFNVLGDADSPYRIAEEKYFGEIARAV